MPLTKLPQTDFSAGMFRDRGQAPPNGVFDLVNSLIHRDGSTYKRGGSAYKSNAAFGAGKLTMLWEGYLPPGQRTVFARSDAVGVLDDDDATPIQVNDSAVSIPRPVKPVTLGGYLLIPGGFIYAGARKAVYDSNTINVTQGSPNVTGVGTSWLANVEPGMLLRAVTTNRIYQVQEVNSNTSLTLSEAYVDPTASGLDYTLNAIEEFEDAGVLPEVEQPSYLAIAGERLIACVGSRAYMSARNNPFSFDSTDYHELPGGVEIIGAYGLGDQVLLFSTDGLWIASNLAYDLTDAYGNMQQRLDHPNPNLVLWGDAGIASYGNAAVIPATDGVWLLESDRAPRLLSRSITKLYIDYVRDGMIPGRAVVYRGHYLLPVLETDGTPVDLLVCNIGQPASQNAYPWSRLAGAGAGVTALAVRVPTATRSSQLLGASGLDTRVLDATGWFEPAAANKNDHDGTTPEWLVIGREIQTGEYDVENLVRRIRVRYELLGATGDDPTIDAAYGTGEVSVVPAAAWGSFDWGAADWGGEAIESSITNALAGWAPESDGIDPYTWEVNDRAREFRVQLHSSTPAARLSLRSIELFVRPQTRL